MINNGDVLNAFSSPPGHCTCMTNPMILGSLVCCASSRSLAPFAGSMVSSESSQKIHSPDAWRKDSFRAAAKLSHHGKLKDFGPKFLGDLAGVIDRASIHNNYLLDPGLNALKASPQCAA